MAMKKATEASFVVSQHLGACASFRAWPQVLAPRQCTQPWATDGSLGVTSRWSSGVATPPDTVVVPASSKAAKLTQACASLTRLAQAISRDTAANQQPTSKLSQWRAAQYAPFLPLLAEDIPLAGDAWCNLEHQALAWPPAARQALESCLLDTLAVLPLKRMVPLAVLRTVVRIMKDGQGANNPVLPKVINHMLGRELPEHSGLMRTVVRDMIAHMQPYVRRYSPSEAAQALHLLAKHHPSEAKQTVWALAEHLGAAQALDGLHMEEVVLVAWACATLRIQPQPLMQQVLQALQQRVEELNAHDLALSFWSVSQLKTPQPQLMAVLQRAAMQQRQAFTGQSVALLAWSAARMHDSALLPLVRDIALSAAATPDQVSTHQLTTIAYAAAVYRCSEPALFQLVTTRLAEIPAEELAEVPPGEKARLLWALSQLSSSLTTRRTHGGMLSHPATRRLAACLERHAQDCALRPQEVGMVLSACALLGHHDPSLTTSLLACVAPSKPPAPPQPATNNQHHHTQLHPNNIPAVIPSNSHSRTQQQQQHGRTASSYNHPVDHIPGPVQGSASGTVMSAASVTQVLHSLSSLHHGEDVHLVEGLVLCVLRALPVGDPMLVTRLAHLVHAAARYPAVTHTVWCELFLALQRAATLQGDHWRCAELVVCLKGVAMRLAVSHVDAPSQHLAVQALLDVMRQRLSIMTADEVLSVSVAALDLGHVSPRVQEELLACVVEHAHAYSFKPAALSSLLLSWSRLSDAPVALATTLAGLLPRLPPTAAAQVAWFCMHALDADTTPEPLMVIINHCNRLVRSQIRRAPVRDRNRRLHAVGTGDAGLVVAEGPSGPEHALGGTHHDVGVVAWGQAPVLADDRGSEDKAQDEGTSHSNALPSSTPVEADAWQATISAAGTDSVGDTDCSAQDPWGSQMNGTPNSRGHETSLQDQSVTRAGAELAVSSRGSDEHGAAGDWAHHLSPVALAQLACVAVRCLGRVPGTTELVAGLHDMLCVAPAGDRPSERGPAAADSTEALLAQVVSLAHNVGTGTTMQTQTPRYAEHGAG